MLRMLSIGKVAKLYGISHDTLRFYDKKGLLKPMVDVRTGYRSYSLESLSMLDMIVLGRTLGIPLSRLGETFDSGDISAHEILLKEQSDIVRLRLQELRETEKRIGHLLSVVERAQAYAEGERDELAKPLTLRRYLVSELLDSPELAHKLDGCSEYLLFRRGRGGSFAEDEGAAYYAVGDACEHESADGFTVARGSACWACRGTLADIRMRVRAVCEGRANAAFVRFDYCVPHRDGNHEYLCAVVVPK